jgi:chlorobactene glucosyltransferase
VNDTLAAVLTASPWMAGAVIGAWRMRGSRELDEWPADPRPDPPLVSVIVPARNERIHIEGCLRAALATNHPSLEVIVIDDHSDDGTGDLARAIAADDSRVRVLENPQLPRGWFGKPWACTTGAGAARGLYLCFTDADARHGPELVSRAIRAMQDAPFDMLSVIGYQELGSFWERVAQPHVFSMLGVRYGGTETVNRSRHVSDKIANGQCIFVRRDAYDAVGGHGAVRDQVAEDLALAQRLFACGCATALVVGRSHLSTRMYDSLGALVRGWRKNVVAGGREAMPGGRAGQWLFPLLLLLPPLLTLLPPVALVLAVTAGGWSWVATAAAIATITLLVWWVLVYRWMDAPPTYALLFPLGGAVLLLIIVQALARGRRVSWKGREYLAPER